MQDRQNKLRYEVVKDLILSKIASQHLQPGDKLPTSNELADQSGFSLISVRRALDELERAGRIVRRQGVGTFVAQSRITAEPGRAGQLLDTLGGALDPSGFTDRVAEFDAGGTE